MNEQTMMIAYLAVFLCAASYTDLVKNRIPNSITFPAILIGIALNTYLHGMTGFYSAVSGSALGIACLLPFYMAGGMAAGDVKLMSAVGAFLGSSMIFKAVLLSLICGSILGIIWLVRSNGIGDFLRRYLLSGKYTLMTGGLQYFPPEKGDPALMRFPYALAIAGGTASVLWFSQ